MKKQVINVPRGIQYLSEWKDFNLPEHPHILNKQITGCGFTQWCLTSNQNTILCSPRRILLENKEDQYLEECEQIISKTNSQELSYKLFYAKNEQERDSRMDINLNRDAKASEINEIPVQETFEYIQEYKQKVKDFYYLCRMSGKSCKILVTYDSYRKVKEALEEVQAIDQFYVVVDEFQSIFTDSRFKSTTEIEFVSHLQDTQKICYASATPMMNEYLDMLDEFKDLPYYELEWGEEEPGRITRPNIQSTPCSRINQKALEIIEKYKTGQWRDIDGSKVSWVRNDGLIQEIISTEAVFYINSVKNICDIIRSSGLKQEECNILCADTEDNRRNIQKAFGVAKKKFLGLGKVPKKSEMSSNKMFTFCTRTVYLGADFWSTCARSFVFSDANIDSLAVDITLDLPQILGRQRYEGNPWKNELNIYFKPTVDKNKISKDEFDRWIENKTSATNVLLRSIDNQANDSEARSMALYKYEIAAKTERYRFDYLAINNHSGSSKEPVFNNLVLVAERRAFDIQQVDYADRCSVRNTIREQLSLDNEGVIEILQEFESKTTFVDKMKYLCSILSAVPEDITYSVLKQVDSMFSNYYTVLGPEQMQGRSYQRSKLEREYKRIINNQGIDLTTEVNNLFSEGDKLSKDQIKNQLSMLYKSLGYKASPKASDLEKWFDLKSIKIKDDVGKWVNGFEILKAK